MGASRRAKALNHEEYLRASMYLPRFRRAQSNVQGRRMQLRVEVWGLKKMYAAAAK